MFNGFTDETFEFFMALKFNNNRPFFHSNHDWYLRAVRGPALELAQELSGAIELLDNDLERNPNRVVSRINRDIRFSNDKSPYRDHIWLGFRNLDDAENNIPAPYFELDANGASFGFGMYRPNMPLMNGLRRELDAGAEEFLECWLPVANEYALYGNTIKRMKVPQQLHSAATPWYGLRGFYIEKEIRDFDLLMSADLADEIAASLQRLTPLYRYFKQLQPAASV